MAFIYGIKSKCPIKLTENQLSDILALRQVCRCGFPSETTSSGGVLETAFLTQVNGFLTEALLERVS
jgi:hypothetical protein